MESALRLARAKGLSERMAWLVFWGGFHGKTAGVMSLMEARMPSTQIQSLLAGHHDDSLRGLLPLSLWTQIPLLWRGLRGIREAGAEGTALGARGRRHRRAHAGNGGQHCPSRPSSYPRLPKPQGTPALCSSRTR